MFYKPVLVCLCSLLLIVCEPQPPHWGSVCVKHNTVTRMELTPECGLGYDGKFGCGNSKLKYVTRNHCTQYKRQCIIDKRWKGNPKTCENMDTRQRS